MNKRIEWLDGIKGIAAFSVFVHHFLLLFLPSSYFGMQETYALTRLNSVASYFSREFFGVIINGNFMVYLFIMIASFLIAYKILNAENISAVNISKLSINRYIRLLIPCLLAGITFYAGGKLLTVVGLNYSNVTHEISVGGLFYRLFIRMWFLPDYEVIGQFWTMWIFFVGTYISIILCLIIRERSFILSLLTTFFACIGLYLLDESLLSVGLGVMLALIVYSKTQCPVTFFQKHRIVKIVIAVILLLIGLFLGGYPTGVSPENYYRLFTKLAAVIKCNPYVVAHSIGAFLCLLAIYLLKPVQAILSVKPFRFLGKVSFSVYVLHYMIIRFVGYYLHDLFLRLTGRESLALIIDFVILSAIILFVSYYYTKLTDRLVQKIRKLFAGRAK